MTPGTFFISARADDIRENELRKKEEKANWRRSSLASMKRGEAERARESVYMYTDDTQRPQIWTGSCCYCSLSLLVAMQIGKIIIDRRGDMCGLVGRADGSADEQWRATVHLTPSLDRSVGRGCECPLRSPSREIMCAERGGVMLLLLLRFDERREVRCYT